jgi:hypothetical protein
MGVFIGFTPDDLDVNNTMSSHGYRVSYTGNEFDVSNPLFGIYQSVMFQCELLLDGYESFLELGMGDTLLERMKTYWLLCNIRFTHFPSQFKSFIIEVNNPLLSDLDYVLLFYVSLQSKETQHTTKGLPLSMVYDMFIPIAEENLYNWKLST